MSLLAVESLGSALAEGAQTPDEMLIVQQRRLIALALIPGIWLLFSLTYARGKAREFLGKWVTLFIAAFVLSLALVLYFRKSLITFAQWEPADSLWIIRLGWAGIILYACLLISAVTVLMNLERTYTAAVGTMRWRIKFMLSGIGLLFVVRIYTTSQALLYRDIHLSVESLNSGAMLVASVLLVGSFIRAGDYDVDVYPSKYVLQNSLTVLLAGVYLVLVGALAKVAAYLGGDAGFALKAFLALISIVAFALLLQSDRARLQLNRFVSRNFHRPVYDYRTTWRQFTEEATARVELTDLCRSLAKLIADTFQALSVAIWLVDERRETINLVASTFLSETKESDFRLAPPLATPLILRLLDHPEPFDIEALKTDWASELRRIHPSIFPNGGRRLCVPLIGQGEVIGMISLGDRVGGLPYSVEDFDMLKCIADHATACLRNVLLSDKILQAKEFEAFQTMAAFFVHDLKNAASTLNLMLQNLPVHFDDPEFRADSLRGISKTVVHINHLIGRLSLLRHEQIHQPTEDDLNLVVAAALTSLGNGDNSTLRKELSPVPKVMLDKAQMLKVVTNLVLNAKESLSENGWIRIGTKVDAHWVVLTVADNGCGMSAEFVSNGLFRPFQTTKKNGLGIGMFQSKMIVEAHGGRIAVASEQGNGTTFQVMLPLVRNAQ
jgi:putative PEP-CTERM system histidine kinase